jgi:hypothetical protein
MTKKERRRRAAKKAANTRAVWRAQMKYMREVVEPTNRRMDSLLAILMKGRTLPLRWNPIRDTGHKLKRGAEYGTLMRFVNGGRLLRVLPDGYKRPKDFHPSYWEPLS